MPVPSIGEVQIAQRACILSGIEKIVSFDQPNYKPAEVLMETYEDIVQDALTIHPWRFATETLSLGPPLATPPAIQFKAGYLLPTDPVPLQVRTVYVGGSICSLYRIYRDAIWLDATPTDAVELEALWREPEGIWPPWFRLYVILRLAAFLTASVTRNGELAAFHASEAEKQLARARTRDSQQQTTTKLSMTKIRSSRFGGRPS